MNIGKKAGIFCAVCLVVVAIVVLNISRIKVHKKTPAQNIQTEQQMVNAETQTENNSGQSNNQTNTGTQSSSQESTEKTTGTQPDVQQGSNAQAGSTVQSQTNTGTQAETQTGQQDEEAETNIIEIDPSSVEYGEVTTLTGMIFDKKMYFDKRSSQLFYKLYVTIPIEGQTINLEYYCAKGVFDAVEINEAVQVDYTEAQGIKTIVKLSK